MTSARARATLAALSALVLASCAPPAEDEAGVPTPAETATRTSADAMAEVRRAAAATLERGGARLTIEFGGDGQDGVTLEGTDDFEQDRRRLAPAAGNEVLVVDGSEVFVRSEHLSAATWGRFDLEEVTAEGTAPTVDLRLLPLTDSADILRTLAEVDGAARAGSDGYIVTLPTDEAEGAGAGTNYWVQRHVETGTDTVDVRVRLDGDAVGQVSYSVPTPTTRGLEQGEQVGGGANGDDGAGIPVTITYGAAAGAEPVERPGDGEVADVPAEDVVELLEWAPTAGALRGPGEEEER